MMPRALFDRIGGWDAGYRLHAEDLDLCRRAREAGAVVAIANDLQVTHVRGVSSRSRPFFVEWHKHKGLWRYFQKFEAKQRSLPVRVAVWCAIWAHAVMLVPRLLRRSCRAEPTLGHTRSVGRSTPCVDGVPIGSAEPRSAAWIGASMQGVDPRAAPRFTRPGA